MIKKREIDIFGILLGVVIGCILGFFLSTRIDLKGTTDDVPVVAQTGHIYLLQINKLDAPDKALTLIQQIKAKGLNAIVVYANDFYYVYGGISKTEAGLNEIAGKFELKGYTYIIKKEYILDKPNSVIENEYEYEFWNECIDNLIKSFDNKPIIINDKYNSNPVNLEVYLYIRALQVLTNEDMINEVRLNIYSLIIEKLG